MAHPWKIASPPPLAFLGAIEYAQLTFYLRRFLVSDMS